jgi:flagellar secretion chaperone FliS
VNPGLTYREAAVVGANPVRLVILLYEQAIEDLRRAVAAQTKSDIEGRTREINHAIQVVGHLQATLDKEQGGRVAENLDRFYEQVRWGIVEAQCRQSVSALELQIGHLLQVHDAWCEVERAMISSATATKDNAAPQCGGEWKG